MGSEPDLRHAISMRPNPFHAHPYAQSRPSTPRAHGRDAGQDPASPEHHVSVGAAATTSSGKNGRDQGKSTAYEPLTPPEELHDAIARTPHPTNAATYDGEEAEAQRLPRYTRENDPYQLASKLKSASEIQLIRANTSRKRDNDGGSDGRGQCLPSHPLDASAMRARRLEKFYEAQNANIQRLLKPVDEHRRQAREEHGDNQLKFKIAVQGSFAANVLLAGLQLYGAASSGSLSLFTTMADALFDPLSNVTLMLSARAVNRVDPRKFPSGKARIETSGNIVFCFIMVAVSAIIIVMSARELAIGSAEETKGFHLPSVIAVAIAFTTKFGLFLYCWALRNMYSQIRILWEDHRNDLLINGFGLLTSIGGSKLKWWIDPMGAIILSCIITFLWLRTAYSEFQLLIGVSADTEMLQLITYISMTHSPFISAIDTVRAYHSGPRLIVEVDIVMDPEETLRATHDVAEDLQIKLESLPNVERAYVHVDYETSHAPEHFLKKEL